MEFSIKSFFVREWVVIVGGFMKKLLSILFVWVAMANVAFAGNSNGQVTHVMAHASEIIIFEAGSHTGKPACSTSGEGWALSLSTNSGRAMYALILMARAQGKTINVLGTGNCSAWGDRETPVYIYSN